MVLETRSIAHARFSVKWCKRVSLDANLAKDSIRTQISQLQNGGYFMIGSCIGGPIVVPSGKVRRFDDKLTIKGDNGLPPAGL